MDEIRKLFGELERERGESGSTYRRRVRKQFVKMDENDDGLISRRELRHAFKRLDLHLDPEVLDTAMETFDMDDTYTSEIFVTESPLNSVTSVQERDSIADSYTTLTANTDYYVDTDHDRIYRIDGEKSTRYFKKGKSKVEKNKK